MMIEAIKHNARMHEMTVVWDEGSRDHLEVVIYGGGVGGSDVTVTLDRDQPGIGSGLPFIERRALLCNSFERELEEVTQGRALGSDLPLREMDERQIMVVGQLQSAHRDLPRVLFHHHSPGQVGPEGIVP